MEALKSIVFLILVAFCAVWVIGRIAQSLVKHLPGILQCVFCVLTAMFGGWDLLQWSLMAVILLNIVLFARRMSKKAALRKELYLQKQRSGQ